MFQKTAEIAEVMARDEGTVARIVRRYIGRKAATVVIIRRLNQIETGAKTAKRPAK